MSAARSLRIFAGELSTLNHGVPEQFLLRLSTLVIDAQVAAFNLEAATQGSPEVAVLRVVEPDGNTGVGDDDDLAAGVVAFEEVGLSCRKCLCHLLGDRDGVVDLPNLVADVDVVSDSYFCHESSPAVLGQVPVTPVSPRHRVGGTADTGRGRAATPAPPVSVDNGLI